MIAGLPYDAEVEYLESTGTQWINTGVIPSVHIGIETDIAITYAPYDAGAFSGMCGSGLFAGGGSYSQYIYRTASDVMTSYMWAFGSTGSFSISIPYGTRTVFGHNFLEDGVVRVDGVQKATLPSNPTLLQYPIALMKLNVANNTSDMRFYVKGRLYHVRISDGSIISHNFVPVRFTNELGQAEGALYDRVSRKLFRNAGTGSFTIGPDVATPVMGLHFMRRPRYTARDYVQTGLIAMWDGEWNAEWGVHDASATSWLDLIGNKQMPTTLSSLSWDSNALVRTGVDGLTYDTGLDFSDPLSERTFEFVISYDADYTDTSSNYFVARFNDISTWLSFWNRTKFGISLYAGGGTNETPFEQPSFKGSVSLVGSSIPYAVNPTQRHYAYYYANGTYFRDGAFGGGSSSSAVMELFAAARNWPSSNTIKIHSIRIYSRALTAAEVAHNYAVDKERFNLT